MGLISGIQAVHAVKRLKAGKRAKLSYGQAADLAIDLLAAKQALPPPQFDALYAFFRTCQADKEKAEVDGAQYDQMVRDILEKAGRITGGKSCDESGTPFLKPVFADGGRA